MSILDNSILQEIKTVLRNIFSDSSILSGIFVGSIIGLYFIVNIVNGDKAVTEIQGNVYKGFVVIRDTSDSLWEEGYIERRFGAEDFLLAERRMIVENISPDEIIENYYNQLKNNTMFFNVRYNKIKKVITCETRYANYSISFRGNNRRELCVSGTTK